MARTRFDLGNHDSGSHPTQTPKTSTEATQNTERPIVQIDTEVFAILSNQHGRGHLEVGSRIRRLLDAWRRF